MDREFEVPQGTYLETLSAAEFISRDEEIWLFRVPKEFPIEKLDGLVIPKSESKQKTFDISTESRLKAKQTQAYTIASSKTNQFQIGEMADFQIVAPGPDGLSAGYEISRIQEGLEEKGKEIRDREYEPRKQPDDMKAQIFPYGASTSISLVLTIDGDLLAEIMERYRTKESKSLKSPKPTKISKVSKVSKR